MCLEFGKGPSGMSGNVREFFGDKRVGTLLKFHEVDN